MHLALFQVQTLPPQRRGIHHQTTRGATRWAQCGIRKALHGLWEETQAETMEELPLLAPLGDMVRVLLAPLATALLAPLGQIMIIPSGVITEFVQLRRG